MSKDFTERLPVIGSRVKRGPGGRFLNTEVSINRRRRHFLSQASIHESTEKSELPNTPKPPESDERQMELQGFVPSKAIVPIPKISIDHGHSRVNLNENLIQEIQKQNLESVLFVQPRLDMAKMRTALAGVRSNRARHELHRFHDNYRPKFTLRN